MGLTHENGRGRATVFSEPFSSWPRHDAEANAAFAAAAWAALPALTAEIRRLRLALVGEEKARALLVAGMGSLAERYDELKHALRDARAAPPPPGPACPHCRNTGWVLGGDRGDMYPCVVCYNNLVKGGGKWPAATGNT